MTCRGGMIVSTFVEFGHETSYMKSSFHTEFKIRSKMLPYSACYYFIDLCCCKALTAELEEKCPKCCLVPMKCQLLKLFL